MRATHRASFAVGDEVLAFLETREDEYPSRLRRSGGQVYRLADGGRAAYVLTEKPAAAAQAATALLHRVWSEIDGQTAKNGWLAAPERRWAIPAYLSPQDFVYTGHKWPVNSVTYRVNPTSIQANAGNGSTADFLNAITAAAYTWTIVPTADFSFIYGGTTSATTYGYNGANEIVFISDGSTSSTLATTIYWYRNSTILEADVWFDDDHLWDATGSPSSGEVDVQSVALHEFGHWLALDHDPESVAVMYAYISSATLKRVLHQNDKDGISFIYPAAATSTPTPPATNTPTPPATNTPTSQPTNTPTSRPTNTPTSQPTSTPTPQPTNTPTPQPTSTPTPTPEVWRFRGYALIGPMSGEPAGQGYLTHAALADVTLRLFGYNQGQTPPGTLIASRTTAADGFWNFFIIHPWVYDTFRLVIESPRGYVVTALVSEQSVAVDETTLEWNQVAAALYLTDIYLEPSTSTPTLTPTPTATPTPYKTWLGIIWHG
ncbi:MAG: matrixin family metalloprotease [Chloroflexi bacterium]|nr:matrixin family metalloprotease [Chloroflexota bacterium]